MRFSICIPSVFGKRPFEDSVRGIRRYGFDAAELWGWQDMDPDRTGEILKENNVTLAAMSTTEYRMTDAAYRKDWLQGLERSLKASEKTGALMLISQVGPDTGESREKQHENIVETLREAAPMLEAYGRTLVIEPLNTYVDHPGYYLTSSKEGAEIVREAGCGRVRMVFDIYHQQIMEGNLIPNIREELPYIAHFHAAGHPGRHEPENGEINYRAVFDAIEESGYQGFVGLEYFPLMTPEQSLTDFRRHFIDRV